MADFCF